MYLSTDCEDVAIYMKKCFVDNSSFHLLTTFTEYKELVDNGMFTLPTAVINSSTIEPSTTSISSPACVLDDGMWVTLATDGWLKFNPLVMYIC